MSLCEVTLPGGIFSSVVPNVNIKYTKTLVA